MNEVSPALVLGSIAGLLVLTLLIGYLGNRLMASWSNKQLDSALSEIEGFSEEKRIGNEMSVGKDGSIVYNQGSETVSASIDDIESILFEVTPAPSTSSGSLSSMPLNSYLTILMKNGDEIYVDFRSFRSSVDCYGFLCAKSGRNLMSSKTKKKQGTLENIADKLDEKI